MGSRRSPRWQRSGIVEYCESIRFVYAFITGPLAVYAKVRGDEHDSLWRERARGDQGSRAYPVIDSSRRRWSLFAAAVFLADGDYTLWAKPYLPGGL